MSNSITISILQIGNMTFKKIDKMVNIRLS